MRKLEIAWRILFVAALVDLVLGVGTLLLESSFVTLAQELSMEEFTGLRLEELRALGPNLFPWIGFVFRSWSAFVIGSSILTMGIAAKAYHKGERWAWFTLVIAHVPTCLIYLSISILLQSSFLLFIGIVVLAYLVGLFLPTREFLGGKQL
ncbi:MAG: hypothetical protein HYU39_03605 [Thaumarchaeota archaeon]|nr:hypothetical protein [Nitrososphaerota archaeon]